MKHLLCTGRIVKGGAVEIALPGGCSTIALPGGCSTITAPVQPERNAEAQAMDADLDRLIANGCPVHFSQDDYEEMEREVLGL